MDWLYPVAYDEKYDLYYYDTSRCLLENNTEVKVRVEATTELETDTPNANDAVEFYFYIDTDAPMDDPSSIRAIAKNSARPTRSICISSSRRKHGSLIIPSSVKFRRILRPVNGADLPSLW